MSRADSIAVLGLLLCSEAALGAVCSHVEPPYLAPLPTPAQRADTSYRAHVAPVLEGRCVVCHGCFDAPCQLVLSSRAGLLDLNRYENL